MNALSTHPDWCRRAGCATTGLHVSSTVNAGDMGDLLGVDVALAKLDGCEPPVLHLTITEDDQAVTYLLPVGQARALVDAITVLMPA